MEDNAMSSKKYKRMQKKCEDYRHSGRREINKAEKQKKHLARIEHFALRKEQGKTYVYQPTTDKKEKLERAEKNKDRRVKIAQLDSWFGRLNYELNQDKIRKKEADIKKRNNKTKNTKV